MVIDAHHHFWDYDPSEYGWISDSMARLRRDFRPQDLRKEITDARVDGVVSVQARQTVDETRWLLDMADANDFIRGVVGWVPLVTPDVTRHLEHFADHPRLKSVRHVLQDELDERYMLREDFNRGVAELKRFNLRYDILIFERQLPQTIEFVDRHPDQVFVLDHAAKPRIRDRSMSPWRENLQELARRENVYCKLSGLVTEADWQAWSPTHVRPFIDVAMEAFGPERLMFGSDWPVCLVAARYEDWFEIVKQMTAALSPAEQARVLGGTAIEAYNL